MSTIVYDCRHFATKVPCRKGPKRPQKCTIVDDCAQIAESGLKPPFEPPFRQKDGEHREGGLCQLGMALGEMAYLRGPPGWAGKYQILSVPLGLRWREGPPTHDKDAAS